MRPAGFDGEKDQQGEMFLGAKFDGLTVRGEQLRLPQAA
jgi:hypothetical protein